MANPNWRERLQRNWVKKRYTAPWLLKDALDQIKCLEDDNERLYNENDRLLSLLTEAQKYVPENDQKLLAQINDVLTIPTFELTPDRKEAIANVINRKKDINPVLGEDQ